VLDDLNWETRPYKRWAAYGQSKLANLLFTIELEIRLEGTIRRYTPWRPARVTPPPL
jgi:hypothetical protein